MMELIILYKGKSQVKQEFKYEHSYFNLATASVNQPGNGFFEVVSWGKVIIGRAMSLTV